MKGEGEGEKKSYDGEKALSSKINLILSAECLYSRSSKRLHGLSTDTWRSKTADYAVEWMLNSERNPDRVLRNANDYYIPQPRIPRIPLTLRVYRCCWENKLTFFLSFFL
jgi:hypothetical protein